LLWPAVLRRKHPAKRKHACKIFKLLLRPITQIDVVRIRELQIFNVPVPQFHSRKHQPVRLFVWKRLQQHSVGHAEDRSASAQTKRDRHHRDHSKLRTPRKHPHRNSQIS